MPLVVEFESLISDFRKKVLFFTKKVAKTIPLCHEMVRRPAV